MSDFANCAVTCDYALGRREKVRIVDNGGIGISRAHFQRLCSWCGSHARLKTV